LKLFEINFILMAEKKKNKNEKGGNKKVKSKKESKEKKGNSNELNWHELYLSIKELREKSKEMDERIMKMNEETQRMIQELAKRQEETDRMIQELAKRQEEDRKNLERFIEEERRRREEERKKIEEERKWLEEEKKRREEERRKMEEYAKQIARITDSWGRFVEGMVEPAAIAYFRKKGFIPFEAHQRLKVSKNGKNAEYDLLLIAPKHKTAMLVSAKTHATSKDVNELERDINSLGFFIDYLKGYKVIGAIAGISFGRGADVFAQRKGFLVLKVSEDNFEILEPKKLKVFKLGI